VAEQAGISEDEIERVQQFESEDEQRAAALRFAREVVESRGHPSDESLEEAREAGYTDEQIIEMVATVVLATFTNYMNDTIQTEVDFPVREPIQSR
jgi:alkylhydroperoxidase family enzyme